MELFLLRHGPALDRDPRRWPDDTLRPLSPDGVRSTRRSARGLAGLVGEADRLLTSPAVRAARTAELFGEALTGAPQLERWEELGPGEPAAGALERLRRTMRGRARVVVVGHEPQLSELLGLSVAGEALSIARLAKAGAAAVEFPRAVTPGAGRLLWMLTRKQLARLGD
jgi:phosphohistidine phosphatase